MTDTKTKPTNPTLQEFFEVALSLAFSGKPDEKVCDEIVTAWVTMASLENCDATWNPEATTQAEDGATPYNSFGPAGSYHVYNYLTAEQGMSAFLKTLGQPQYAALRTVMTRMQGPGGACLSEATDNVSVLLAAIATSPWTGVQNDPTLYANTTPDSTRIVSGPGGWPYATAPTVAEPTPESDEKAAPTEEQKVESAINAQTAAIEKDSTEGLKAKVKNLVGKIGVHLAELQDLTK